MTRAAARPWPRSACALLAGAFLICIAACTPTLQRPEGEPASWEQRRTRLAGLQEFSFKGRLAAAVNGEGFSASLQWEQKGRHSALDLRAPLGFGTAHVERDAGGEGQEKLLLRTSRGERLADDEARAALERRLGFAAPLASLPYWIRGLPDPGRPAVETLGDDARLSGFEQDGWRVEYSEYGTQSIAGLGTLPRRLVLTREGIRLRVVVDDWRIGGS